MYVVKMFLVPYIITIIVEIIAAIIWGIRRKRELLAVLLINTVTNPLVTLIRWIAAQHLRFQSERDLVLAAAEIAVLLGEWLLFRKFVKSTKHPFLMSLVLNAVSFGAGLLTPYIFIALNRV